MERIYYAAAYVGAMLASVALTPLVVAWARRWGVVDLPNSRKVHENPTPRLGGLAIAASMIGVSLVALLAAQIHLGPKIVVALCASLFVLGVGVLDDLLNLSSKFKLLALIAAATAVCGVGVRIDTLHGFLDLNLGGLAWPVTILWIVGITVSVNFIDGLDGLAAGIAAIACAVIAVTTSCYGQVELAIISLALLGSLTGFLFFNFNPARVFMGDGGSMFIGFSLATLSVLQAPRMGTTVGLVLPILALAVPILDTMLTMVRRVVLHRGSLFVAERGHIHHRLLDLGLGQRHAVLILYSASLVSAGVGLLALLDHGWPTLAGLALLLPLLLGLFSIAGSTRLRETIAAIRRNRAISRETKKYARAFESLQLEFRNVKGFDGWWAVICRAADILDFVALELPLTRRDGARHYLRWTRSDGQHAGCEILDATIPILQRRQGGNLRAHVEVASHEFVETAGQRVAFFARLMGDHGLTGLPDSNKRVRARGPAGEKSAPGSIGNGNGYGSEPETGNGNGNGHVSAKEHAHEHGNGRNAGNGTTLPASRHRHGDKRSGIGSPIIRLMPSRQELSSSPEVGIAATLETTDLPALADPSRKGVSGRKIAIVHDFLYCYAGAERVLEQILRVFPHADIFALFDFMPKDQRGFLLDKPVHTTFIQKLPFARHRHRLYLPLMPLAIEQLDVSEYDIVISSSYLAAKGVLTRPDQLHVCYCHTPVRFAWDLQHQYLKAVGLGSSILSFLPRLVFHYLRTWDVRSANGVDVFITNSAYVGRRIGKLYRRRATTIYPPVDTERFTPGAEQEDFYLTASRMVPYKRIDLIVAAFNQMPQRRLIVVGDGPEFDRIRAMAGPNIRLVGHQPAEKLKQYMQFARAFLFAAEEDFGIVPVEAQACGTPVIAFGRGGVTESVVAGRTGVFFDEQTPESIVAAVEEFERKPRWERDKIRENAERFSATRFRAELGSLIEAEWNNFNDRRIALPGNASSENLRTLVDVTTDVNGERSVPGRETAVHEAGNRTDDGAVRGAAAPIVLVKGEKA